MAEFSPIARAALSTCRFTACRVSEGLQLNWGNITQSHVVIPKAITKKKVRTRRIPLNPRLAQERGLEDRLGETVWSRAREDRLHFPGRQGLGDLPCVANGVQQTRDRGGEHAFV